jgi:hypothetical protein
MSVVGSFLQVEYEADHISLFSAEAKNVWGFASTPIHLNGTVLHHRNAFTFTLTTDLFFPWEIGLEDVDWTCLAQDREWTLVNTVMNLQVP